MFANQRGSILPQLRQKLVETALSYEGMTHMLFVDSDMDFPRDILHRWLPLNKPIIAANCCTKKIPSNPTARSKVEGNKNGARIFTTPEKAKACEVERVWRIGTGVMLIDLSIFKKVSAPYFPMNWDTQYNDWYGEDWGFCSRVEKQGIPIYVEHSVSWEVKHLGEAEYGHDLVMLQEYQKILKQEEQEKVNGTG